MLSHIVTHTPVYVWAILAFLVARGVIASRAREVAVRKLWIIPLVMLALSLQDIAAKFGAGALPLAAWALGGGAATLLVLRFGPVRVAPGGQQGSVRVAGSWAPLALMMAVFCTKYAASVAVAIVPHLRQDSVFAAAVCILFGIFNGCFLGRLLADLAAARGFALAAPAINA
jgi:hypothetical protein